MNNVWKSFLLFCTGEFKIITVLQIVCIHFLKKKKERKSEGGEKNLLIFQFFIVNINLFQLS